MKKLLFLTFIMVVFLVSGCNTKDNAGKNQETKPVQNEVDQELKKEEKHLVWYLDEAACQNVDPEIFSALNKLLKERGFDFVVDFESHPSKTEEEYKEYQKILRKHKECNEPVDIIFTGNPGAESGEYSTYQNAVSDGLLLPLDDYLKSDEGKKLRTSFSENFPKDENPEVFVGNYALFQRHQMVLNDDGTYGRKSVICIYTIDDLAQENFSNVIEIEGDLFTPMELEERQ